jgi:Tfp pilus assembly protein PilN
MDMRKEIKLSDLFKRKPKQDDVEMETTDPTEPAEKKPSRFALTRKKSEEAEPKEPKAPKEPRRKKSAKGAGPALADVPLMRAFNLMPKDAASGGDAKRVNPARLAIAVAALVVFALLASMFLIANARVADKSTELNALKSQLAALDVPAQEPAATPSDPSLVAERDSRTTALSTALGSRVQWDRFLRDISLVLPDDVWLTTMISSGGVPPVNEDGSGPTVEQLEASKSVIELNGFSRSAESVATLLSRVQSMPQVESATLVNATATTLSGQKLVQFTISATLKPPGAGS